MVINWPLIVLLFGISLPGVLITMNRLVLFLLPQNTAEMKTKASRLVIFQTLFMVFAMSFTGAVLSVRTGLGDPVLIPLLQGKEVLAIFLANLWPTLLYTLVCFIIFCVLYYGLVRSILDEQSLVAMSKLRAALKIDGCILYGGIVEEVVARWGFMNLIAFFAFLFTKQMNAVLIAAAIVISGLMFAIGQIPVYIAAGCVSTRRLVYSLTVLSLCQSLFFGVIFWQYGLVYSILAHVLFHLFWAGYERT